MTQLATEEELKEDEQLLESYLVNNERLQAKHNIKAPRDNTSRYQLLW